MNNELRIKPLRQYEVARTYPDGETVVFTADDMVKDGNDLLFFRTGNLIRAFYDVGPVNVVVTPVEALDEGR